MELRERTRSKVSVGPTGGLVLRCADCEHIIRDDVLDWSPSRLEYAAQDHRCDMVKKTVEQIKHMLKEAEEAASDL